MDTITHALFGYGIYGATNKTGKSKEFNKALIFTTILASQIPDIDVVVNITETGRIMNQMWHRGLTHSIFLTPLWAYLIYFLSQKIFKVKDFKLFWIGLISVIIHDTSDIFNAWGTGYLEPFSNIRLTFGVIPILDFVIWAIFLVTFIVTRLKKYSLKKTKLYKLMWLSIGIYFLYKSSLGYYYYSKVSSDYDKTTLAASFVPTNFSIITKKENVIDIYTDGIFINKKLERTIISDDTANLKILFEGNPKAKVLYQWAPFIVIEDKHNKIGIYDPRIFNGDKPLNAEYYNKPK
ncbi:MAG: hydrolase [Bacillales bacterium]|jgi:inner membrane protein|nr:hydrolase [Bacillales bacterium]